ncbi:NAD(P)-dependent oxidoreductase [Clostridium polynesiense]|uniref:NAD(P)-dependent oxidoreductase n=1 Tax=Clostridium polynesiense TaxID=1325933 RepID=UPI00058FCF7F|nr:NAD(P)-dependent oxidoreductase [Clostridium polynesiense]
MKVLFTFKEFLTDKKEELESLGYELYYEKESSLEFKPYMEEIDILVCYNPFNNVDIKRFKNLKWIQLSSVGLDQISEEVGEYIKEQGIILTNNKGGYGIPIGEWIVMNILELSKKSYDFFENRRERKWKPIYNITEIYGKTIGMLGTGSIAIEAAKRLKPFEVEILGVNTDGRAVEHFDKCYSMKDINLVLNKSDVVVVTLPNTEDTYHILNEKALDEMKEESCLINVSRGRVIDEDALIRKLEKGDIKGAALDVFEEEPLAKESRLWDFKNVIITPHNSWVSDNSFHRRTEMFYENLKRYSLNEKLLNTADFKKGY